MCIKLSKGAQVCLYTFNNVFWFVKVKQRATGRKLTMKSIKHAEGRGGVLNAYIFNKHT
jgi:hypothetical protein